LQIFYFPWGWLFNIFGIPTAGNLVENWLPGLKKLETGEDGDLNNWLIEQFWIIN